MAINIGSQTGGVINNVDGNQTIYGGQHGGTVTSGAARQAVDQLAEALAQSAVPDDPVIAGQTEQLRSEMRTPEPDKGRIAACLERLTKVLTATQSWVKAGAAVLGPIRTIATWLGALGLPILGMLPAML